MVTNAQQTKYDTSSTHLHANREKHWASVFLPELSQVLADKCEVQKFSGVLWLSRFSSTEQHIPITAFLSSLLHCSIIQPNLSFCLSSAFVDVPFFSRSKPHIYIKSHALAGSTVTNSCYVILLYLYVITQLSLLNCLRQMCIYYSFA